MADPLDDVLGPSTSASDPLDDVLGPAQRSKPAAPVPWSEGMGRSLIAGATMGFDDEIVGAFQGQGAADQRRSLKKQFAQEQPTWDAVGQIGGAIPTMIVPGGAVMRSAAAARTAMGGGRLARLATGYGAQGAALGVPYGAATRAGNADGKDLSGRIEAATSPSGIAADAALGAVGGKIGGWIGDRIGGAIQASSNATRRAGVSSGAREVSDIMAADQVTPEQVMGVLFPQNYGRIQMQPEAGHMAVADVYAAMANGLDRAAAIRQAAANIAAQPERMALHGRGGRNLAQGTIERHVRQSLAAYERHNSVPVQMHEAIALAAQRPGGSGGMATRDTVERILNSGAVGPEAGSAYQWAIDRQGAQAGRMANIFQRMLGDGDVRSLINETRNRVSSANAMYPEIVESWRNTPEAGPALQQRLQWLYDRYNNRVFAAGDNQSVRLQEQLKQLQRLFTRNREVIGEGTERQAQASRRVPVRDPETDEIVAYMEHRSPVFRQGEDGIEPKMQYNPGGSTQEIVPLSDLGTVIDNRAALRGLRDQARRTGNTSDEQLYNELYHDVTNTLRQMADDDSVPDAVRNIVRQWTDANDARFGAGQLTEAWTLGQSLNTGAKQGQALTTLEQTLMRAETMPPEPRSMFLRGFMAQIRARLETGGDMHDVAKIFTNPRMRRLMTEFLGPQQAQEVMTHVQRAAIGTSTVRMRMKSPTAKNMQGGAVERALASISSAMELLNPRGILKAMGEYGSQQLGRRRMNESIGILGTTSERPDLMIQQLQRLNGIQPVQPRDPGLIEQHARWMSPFIGSATATQQNR